MPITAFATTDGVPEIGTAVTFAVFGTGLTPIQPTALNTDVAGQVTHTFTGCVAGNILTVVVSTADGRSDSIVITAN